MGLWAEAFKRVAAIKLAEFTIMYHEELDRREVPSEDNDEKVTVGHPSLELSDDNSADEINVPSLPVAKRRFGFGLPDISTADRTGPEV
jgi:hypothetical protein